MKKKISDERRRVALEGEALGNGGRGFRVRARVQHQQGVGAGSAVCPMNGIREGSEVRRAVLLDGPRSGLEICADIQVVGRAVGGRRIRVGGSIIAYPASAVAVPVLGKGQHEPVQVPGIEKDLDVVIRPGREGLRCRQRDLAKSSSRVRSGL